LTVQYPVTSKNVIFGCRARLQGLQRFRSARRTRYVKKGRKPDTQGRNGRWHTKRMAFGRVGCGLPARLQSRATLRQVERRANVHVARASKRPDWSSDCDLDSTAWRLVALQNHRASFKSDKSSDQLGLACLHVAK